MDALNACPSSVNCAHASLVQSALELLYLWQLIGKTRVILLAPRIEIRSNTCLHPNLKLPPEMKAQLSPSFFFSSPRHQHLVAKPCRRHCLVSRGCLFRKAIRLQLETHPVSLPTGHKPLFWPLTNRVSFFWLFTDLSFPHELQHLVPRLSSLLSDDLGSINRHSATSPAVANVSLNRMFLVIWWTQKTHTDLNPLSLIALPLDFQNTRNGVLVAVQSYWCQERQTTSSCLERSRKQEQQSHPPTANVQCNQTSTVGEV